jgi:DNA-binding transcriptional MerR regulator
MGWFPPYCFADEILFKDKGVQVGTVMDEDEQTVTIRFPKDSIQSVVRTQKGAPLAQKSDAKFLEKVEQLQQRIERLERKQAEPQETGHLPTPLSRPERKQEGDQGISRSFPPLPEPAPKETIHEQLLQEELGRVQGVIQWKGKPLADGKVRIVLEKYTGVSLASVKKMLSENGKEPSETDQEISLATKTDSEGRYAFKKVPPGSYRLFWWPDFQTGWVHRLREKPDFEVKRGQSIIQNIPEKLSILKVRKKE